MDWRKEVARLEREFPGRTVIRLPEDEPTELVCEIEQTAAPDQSVAIAVIDASRPHVHRETIEVYLVEEGPLFVTVDDRCYTVETGGSLVIRPGQVHFARGVAARVRVIAAPAWRASDHTIVK